MDIGRSPYDICHRARVFSAQRDALPAVHAVTASTIAMDDPYKVS